MSNLTYLTFSHVMARYRRYARRQRRSRGRRVAFSSSRMWKTALATHEGTSIARFTDVTQWPRVLPSGDSAQFQRAYLRADTTQTLGYLFSENIDGDNPDDVTKPRRYPNWVLPEYYAFRDGLHLRMNAELSGGRYDVFTPAPGPVLGTPTAAHRKDPSELAYTTSYAGKCLAISPGTLWNVWQKYAGIERGYSRGQREGRSILSLGLDIHCTLTPACLNIPVAGVTDDQAASATSTGKWAGKVGVPPVDNTSYVMPTWATVLVYSYRKSSQDFVDPDDVHSDTPAHKSNTLSWIKNRNAQVQHDPTGARTTQPAECYMGRIGSLGTGFYRPGIDNPDGAPGLVADYNIPFLRSSPIRQPSDVSIDTSVVKVHAMKTVRFPNQRTALRDSETTLEHRWATGRQYDWEYLNGAQARVIAGETVGPAGTIGGGQPPSLVGAAATSAYTPGIVALQKPPKVQPKQVSFHMRFNGKRVDFDDDQDDELPQAAVVGAAGEFWEGGGAGGWMPVVDQQTTAEYVMQEEERGVSHQVRDTTPGGNPLAIAVSRKHNYADNNAYSNLYMTVITPCYKVPVASSAWETSHASSAFVVPNWGSVPVKVSIDTNYTFKR